MENVKNFIDSIIQGNNSEAQQAFDDIIGNRIVDALEQRKQEIASSLFVTQQDVSEE